MTSGDKIIASAFILFGVVFLAFVFYTERKKR